MLKPTLLFATLSFGCDFYFPQSYTISYPDDNDLNEGFEPMVTVHEIPCRLHSSDIGVHCLLFL